jgi:HTH-type transcriptional regulator/antitoxin HipB
MEASVRYPIKTPSQLPLVLKGFRKARGLTQAAIAQRLGITQQSYAYFEANPASATLDRLFVVMRILGVEIVLDQVDMPDVTRKALSVTASNPVRVAQPARKKEAW